MGGIVVVRYFAVENGIFDCLLYLAKNGTRGNIVLTHNDVAGDWRLEVTNTVALLEVTHLLAHKLEVGEEAFNFALDT